MKTVVTRLTFVASAALILSCALARPVVRSLSDARRSWPVRAGVRLVARADEPAVTGPRITSDAGLPAAWVGLGYEQRLAADREHDEDGGTIAWSVVAGELPLGLALISAADGPAKIAGIPATAGEYAFTLAVRSVSGGDADTRNFTLSVLTSASAGDEGSTPAARSSASVAVKSATARDRTPVSAAMSTFTSAAMRLPAPTVAAATAPTIVSGPNSQSANLTDSVTFSVITSGTPPSYQWQKDTVNIPDAVDHTLVLSSVTLADAGSYRVVVTNSAGTQTSAGDISDHGWCAAHGLLWRCDAGGASNTVTVQKPPTAQNYAIGSFGHITGDGVFVQPAGFIELANQEPTVRSLYRAQLADRLANTAADGVTSVTVVNDTFTDNRSGNTPPTSLAWWASGATSTLTGTSGVMALSTDGTTSRHAVAHFPAQDLGIGDTLTWSFDFSLTNPHTDGVIRLGLFNSNGNSLYTADNTNPNVTYTGYAVLTNVAPQTANPTSFKQRGATTAAALITQSGAYGASFGAGGPTAALIGDTTYHAAVTLTLTGVDSAALAVTYTGGSLGGYTVTTDVTGIVSHYDTVAICGYGSGGTAGVDRITVDNVALTYRTTR